MVEEVVTDLGVRALCLEGMAASVEGAELEASAMEEAMGLALADAAMVTEEEAMGPVAWEAATTVVEVEAKGVEAQVLCLEGMEESLEEADSVG